ncbi:hypothetical protein [Paracoccus amoyensis]|uniref:hypothetical protein n=1 Tax=Paracoccus amoyensis TaxID=2760093 RepID=UPI001CA9CBC3|nr:hypothetical protein [Paracoccus amoyensis]
MSFDVNPKDISVAEYLKFFGNQPGGIVLRWQFAGDHGERLSILEEALDRCYSRLVDTRGLNEDRSEDELSMQVANMLSASGISARHDRHINGHCDIVVDAEDGFMWLGEAKIHSDYSWLADGFLQLSTRYGTAMEGRDHGELIIYHRAGNSLNVLTTWQDRLFANHPDTELSFDIAQPKLFFRTVHKCPNSGCDFHVRHTIIPLMHAPEK